MKSKRDLILEIASQADRFYQVSRGRPVATEAETEKRLAELIQSKQGPGKSKAEVINELIDHLINKVMNFYGDYDSWGTIIALLIRQIEVDKIEKYNLANFYHNINSQIQNIFEELITRGAKLDLEKLVENPRVVEFWINHNRANLITLSKEERARILDPLNSYGYDKRKERFSGTIQALEQQAEGYLQQLRLEQEKAARKDLKLTVEEKQALLNKFDKLGDIAIPEICLVIAAKENAETNPNRHVFMISTDDHRRVEQLVSDLLSKPTEADFHRFQFILKNSGSEVAHYGFGEIIIDKRGEQPSLKLFFSDPTLNLLSYSDVLGSRFLDDLANKTKATIEMYTVPQEMLQKTAKGCSYFSLDGTFMLSNQEKYEDLYHYMKTAPESHTFKPSEHQRFSDISSPLPPRLKRGSQRYEAGGVFLPIGSDLFSKMDYFHVRGLKDDVLDKPEEAKKIVNKKGQTAEESIRPQLKEVEVKDKRTGKVRTEVYNYRVEHKRANYKEKAGKLLGKIETHGELDNIIDSHSIAGLEKYRDRQLDKGKEEKVGRKLKK